MSANTPEDREYLILKTIEGSEEIGFNQLQKKTGMPKKTLVKYLNGLIKNGTISKHKGQKPNSRVKYTVNFSEHTKEAINHNLKEIEKYHQWYIDTKYRKLNTFPHYLQELAAEYYQNMISYLFYNIPSYKFGIKRLEEILEKEKVLLDKEFKGKNRLRLLQGCQEVHFYLSGNGSDSIYHAADRRNPRTRDEIQIDCVNPHMLGMGTQHKEEKKLFGIPLVVPIGMGAYQRDFRVHQIKDEKTKNLFIELADEYDKLSQRLLTIKYRLAGITGAYSFEPKTTDDDFFF